MQHFCFQHLQLYSLRVLAQTHHSSISSEVSLDTATSSPQAVLIEAFSIPFLGGLASKQFSSKSLNPALRCVSSSTQHKKRFVKQQVLLQIVEPIETSSHIALALFSHWSPRSGEHHSSVLVQVSHLEHHPSETWDSCSHQFCAFPFRVSHLT